MRTEQNISTVHRMSRTTAKFQTARASVSANKITEATCLEKLLIDRGTRSRPFFPLFYNTAKAVARMLKSTVDYDNNFEQREKAKTRVYEWNKDI
jgi:hypothetical protein